MFDDDGIEDASGRLATEDEETELLREALELFFTDRLVSHERKQQARLLWHKLLPLKP